MSSLEFSKRCPEPLEGQRGPETQLSRLCGWFWDRDYFWVAWRIADLYRLIHGPRSTDNTTDKTLHESVLKIGKN